MKIKEAAEMCHRELTDLLKILDEEGSHGAEKLSQIGGVTIFYPWLFCAWVILQKVSILMSQTWFNWELIEYENIFLIMC